MPDKNFDTVELAEMLVFLNDWLAADQDARISLDRFVGRVNASRSVRDALYKFSFLLGGTYSTGTDDPKPA